MSAFRNLGTLAHKLTPAQIAEFRNAFNLFDADEKGRIKSVDLEPLLRNLGQNSTENELAQMVSELKDPDHVEFLEFLSAISRRVICQPVQDALDAFRFFDSEGDGRISAVFLRRVLMQYDLTSEEIEEMLSLVNIDADGKFEYLRFVDQKNISRS